jgi:hypothetical protein
MYDSVQYGRVGIECIIMLHSISTLAFSTPSYIISLLLHTVHYHTFYSYHSILYTILHYIPTRLYCKLSYILSLLFHTVHYHTFYSYSSIIYIILHSNPIHPYCTLSYILSPLLHFLHHLWYCTVWKSRDRMYDNVQYGQVGIACKIVYSIEW